MALVLAFVIPELKYNTHIEEYDRVQSSYRKKYITGVKGFLWGVTERHLLRDLFPFVLSAKSYVIRTVGNSRLSFYNGIILFSGSLKESAAFILAESGPHAVIGGEITVGNAQEAVTGPYGYSVAGDEGTAESGDYGIAVVGKNGEARTKWKGRVSGGMNSHLVLENKEEDLFEEIVGKDSIKPDVFYQLTDQSENSEHFFVPTIESMLKFRIDHFWTEDLSFLNKLFYSIEHREYMTKNASKFGPTKREIILNFFSAKNISF